MDSRKGGPSSKPKNLHNSLKKTSEGAIGQEQPGKEWPGRVLLQWMVLCRRQNVVHDLNWASLRLARPSSWLGLLLTVCEVVWLSTPEPGRAVLWPGRPQRLARPGNPDLFRILHDFGL